MEFYLNDVHYYHNYLLDDMLVFDLTARQLNLLDACIFLVDSNATIRTTARNTNWTKSTLHRLIHTELKSLSYELYQCTVRVLRRHKHTM